MYGVPFDGWWAWRMDVKRLRVLALVAGNPLIQPQTDVQNRGPGDRARAAKSATRRCRINGGRIWLRHLSVLVLQWTKEVGR